MGMFDYIRCEMPLPADPKPPAVEWFQTKDVPTGHPYLENWMIRSDGRLVKFGVRYEDKSDPKAEGIMRLRGMASPVPVPELDKVFDDFHGDICFGHYDHITGEDWDYIARFTDGVCTKISCRHTPPKSQMTG